MPTIRYDETTEYLTVFNDKESVFEPFTVAGVMFEKHLDGKAFSLKVVSKTGETKCFGRAKGDILTSAVAQQVCDYLKDDLQDK
jgi:hypothetical protein